MLQSYRESLSLLAKMLLIVQFDVYATVLRSSEGSM